MNAFFQSLKASFKKHFKLYVTLFFVFLTGISCGAFTVHGLCEQQKTELLLYIKGFFELYPFQKVHSGEIFRLGLIDHLKVIICLWFFGVTIVGIPLIYFFIGFRGFLIGFTSGIVISSMGPKGILFLLLTLFPRECVILPVIVTLGINGILFSVSIIKSKSKNKLTEGPTLLQAFFKYSIRTIILACFIIIGLMYESYFSPIMIRIISS